MFVQLIYPLRPKRGRTKFRYHKLLILSVVPKWYFAYECGWMAVLPNVIYAMPGCCGCILTRAQGSGMEYVVSMNMYIMFPRLSTKSIDGWENMDPQCSACGELHAP